LLSDVSWHSIGDETGSKLTEVISSDPSDRPTAETLLKHSTFCVKDPWYNFYDTDLAAKLRTMDAAALPDN
jgi:hypothetical protein